MIRAVFFDLDGTLLDSDKKIPQSARNAIARVRKLGTKVFFATARSPRLRQTIHWTDEEFSLFDGGIYENGACVEIGNEQNHCYIDPRAVKICIDGAAKWQDVHLSLHTPQDGYAFNFLPDERIVESWGLKDARILEINEETIRRTTKMMIFYDRLTDSVRELPPELWPELKASCDGLANVYLTDAGRSIQVTGKDSGKLKAIEGVRKRLGFGIDEVAVFGDDVNDLEMISFYPNSVAMGNAVPEVKAAARFVTAANDEGGIALQLDKMI